MKLTYAILAAAAVALLAGCDSNPTSPPGPAARITAISAPSGVPAGATASDSALALVVDANGRGVPGVKVMWRSFGGVVLSPFESLTDADGYARTSVRSTGAAGHISVFAGTLTTTGPQEAEFAVTVVPGPATAILGVPSAALSLPLYGQRAIPITAVDAYNNQVPVSFSTSNAAVVDVTSAGVVTTKAVGSATLTVASGSLQASIPVTVESTLIDDDFDGENGGHAELSYHRFSRWTLSRGDADLIGAGSEWDFAPGHGLYVDLDGYYAGGMLVTRDIFILPAGSYTLSFKLAGSQRGDENTVTVRVGNLWSEQFTVASGAPFTSISRVITFPQQTSVNVSFDQPGADGFGALLDDVKFTKN